MTSKALIICLFRWFCPGEGVFYCIKISRNIDPNKCIGCGICTTKCGFDAIHLHRVHPDASIMRTSEDKFGGILPYMIKRTGNILFKKNK